MFSKNGSGRDERASVSSAPGSGTRGGNRGMFSVLGTDVVITGNISATADLHIDGRVEGDVHCGALAQGAESRIVGSVTADTARIAGTIEGAVHVRQLTVERSAHIIGDVEYESITIEQGGNVDGRMKHVDPNAAPSGPRAVPPAPADTAGEEEAA